MGRMDNLDNLLAAFNNVAPEKLHPSIDKGQQIQVDEVTINVMNKPFRSLHNTFNNSSVAYRLDLNGKRILFLGDMGWDAGQNLLKKNKPEDLKADIVQMAHLQDCPVLFRPRQHLPLRLVRIAVRETRPHPRQGVGQFRGPVAAFRPEGGAGPSRQSMQGHAQARRTQAGPGRGVAECQQSA